MVMETARETDLIKRESKIVVNRKEVTGSSASGSKRKHGVGGYETIEFL
jgi:hypothetical protein